MHVLVFTSYNTKIKAVVSKFYVSHINNFSWSAKIIYDFPKNIPTNYFIYQVHFLDFFLLHYLM